MKKKIVTASIISISVFAVLLVLSLCKPVSLLPREDGIIGITISSLPEGYNYSFAGADADTIVKYLSGIELISEFEENPERHVGMVWVISVKYETGDITTIYHFGNRFIRVNNGPWYKMNFDEASQFDSLLEQLIN